MNFTATPEAVEAMKTVIQQRGPGEGPQSVRVMVAHQCGCGSTKFQMGFDDPEEGDSRIDVGGITMLVDPHSAEALVDARLEVVESDNLIGPRFNIATAGGGGCGCGGGGHSH
ncbi:MAG: iron-sulfur cluster biosynthesis family protein [Chloroflexota bacterium]